MDGSARAALDVVQIHDYAGVERTLGFGQGLAKQKQNRNGERDNWTTTEVFGGRFDFLNAFRAGSSVANCGRAER